MNKLVTFLGGALLGAAALGLASYLTVKHSESRSADASSIDYDDEESLEAHSESAANDNSVTVEEAV